jgi:integrase
VARGWLKDNPARRIDLLREDKPEIDPLSLVEVQTFVSDGLDDDEDRRYFRIAFFTGLRPGEEIGLQWDDIDLGGRMAGGSLAERHDAHQHSAARHPDAVALDTAVKPPDLTPSRTLRGPQPTPRSSACAASRAGRG